MKTVDRSRLKMLTERGLKRYRVEHPKSLALREMTRRFGSLLIIDEAHTICSGPGGLTRAWNLKPDIFTLGKPIAGGMPAAIVGFSQNVAERFKNLFPRPLGGINDEWSDADVGSNALAIAAMRAALEHVITESAYERKIPS